MDCDTPQSAPQSAPALGAPCEGPTTLAGYQAAYPQWVLAPTKPPVPGSDQHKKPLGKWGDVSRTDPSAFRVGCGYLVRTGAISGICVVDVDNKNDGLSTWQALVARYGNPECPTVGTPSGGLHLYFEYDDTTAPIKSRANFVINGKQVGVDVRNDGGYVLCPPSRNPEGVAYTWQRGGLPPVMPQWLADVLIQGQGTKPSRKRKTPCVEEPAAKRPAPEVDHSQLGPLLANLPGVLDCLKDRASGDRQKWLNVGFAVYNATHGHPDALAVWAEWSRCEEYPEPAEECATQWRSMSVQPAPALLALVQWALRDNAHRLLTRFADPRKPVITDPNSLDAWGHGLARIQRKAADHPAWPTREGALEELRGWLTSYFLNTCRWVHADRHLLLRSVNGELITCSLDSCRSEISKETISFQYMGQPAARPGRPATDPAAVPDVEQTGKLSVSEHFDGIRNARLSVDRTENVPFCSLLRSHRSPHGVLNLWPGCEWERLAGLLDKVEGGFRPELYQHWLGPILGHAMHLVCSNNEEDYRVLCRWTANLVQNTTNPKLCLVVVGPQRSGKSTWVDFMRRVLGDHASKLWDSPSQLTGEIQGRMDGVLLHQIEECDPGAAPGASRGKLMTRFKTLTAGNALTERCMRQEHKLVVNHSSTMVTGDRIDRVPVPQDKAGMARYRFLSASGARVSDADYWHSLHEVLADDNAAVSFYRYFAHYALDPAWSAVGLSNAEDYCKQHLGKVQSPDEFHSLLTYVMDARANGELALPMATQGWWDAYQRLAGATNDKSLGHKTRDAFVNLFAALHPPLTKKSQKAVQGSRQQGFWALDGDGVQQLIRELYDASYGLEAGAPMYDEWLQLEHGV